MGRPPPEQRKEKIEGPLPVRTLYESPRRRKIPRLHTAEEEKKKCPTLTSYTFTCLF